MFENSPDLKDHGLEPSRNHQGIGNRVISPTAVGIPDDGPIARRQRLSGMLNYYERLAA